MSSDPIPAPRSADQAFCCAVTTTILARVRRIAGEPGVSQLLDEAGSNRTAAYLEDVGNWVGVDEAVALWDAGEAVTRDPSFARNVGEDGVKVLGGSATASIMRSFGSPEAYLERLAVVGQRYTTAAQLSAIEVHAGYAEIRAVASEGVVRSRQHCEWTRGMLSLAPSLFGLPAAHVEHPACQALGAPDCRYFLNWDPAGAAHDDSEQVTMLRGQLESLTGRLEGVFATAADLISTGDLNDTLTRIADRAAQQVRAPRYLLAVRPSPGGGIVCHQRGLEDDEADEATRRLFANEELPEHWCAVEIRSNHREYGWLVAMCHEGMQFLPQERELLELYARYAATALDSATALLEARTSRDEAQRRHEEARALLELARHLASAGASDEVAARLAETVPLVIDCDRVSVWLWDEAAGEDVRRAVSSTGDEGDAGATRSRPSEVPRLAMWLKQPTPEPHFTDMFNTPIADRLRAVGAVAAVSVPIATKDRYLGSLFVSVRESPERLTDTPELRERLSGVAAHAVIALENGRLVDRITHQARHDQLTGLANRLAFNERIAAATGPTADESKPFALFYLDLDRFKPVNDDFGHEVGDDLLRAVAERLSNCARPEDTVARLGGDEFAVIVDSIDDQSELDPIAARFENAFQAPFLIDGQTLVVEASIGRAVWPLDALDVDGLLREADATMYQSKRSRADRNGSRDRGPARRLVGGASPSSKGCRTSRQTSGSASQQS